MPKKILTAYMYFNIEELANAKKNLGDSKLNCVEIAKSTSSKWAVMTLKQKEKYDKLNLKDQARYNEQLEQIRKNGYFTNEDGVKSTDLPQKQKKSKKPA